MLEATRRSAARTGATSVSRPSSIVTVAHRPDGVALLTIDDHADTFNTITPALAGELGVVLEQVLADSSVRAVVVQSGKRDSFLVGANLDFVRTIRFASDAEEASREIVKRFARLSGRRTKPVVAWVHGSALGAGFELALACTAAIASDDRKTTFGLPEVTIGLVPAANGLLRIAERAGLSVALDLGLSGRSLRAQEARRLGLVDEVAPAAQGVDRASRLALRLADDPKALRALWRARRSGVGVVASTRRMLVERNPFGRRVLFRRARAEARATTRGHYPAPERIIDLLERFGAHGFGAAAKIEPTIFGELVVSETAHRLIDSFFAQTALKKDSGLDASERAAPFPLERVAVIGAGLRGAGIALASAEARLEVRLEDSDEAAVRRGLDWVKRQLDERARSGAITRLERDTAFARVTGRADDARFADVDVVIEAVFEDLALKHSVIRDVERLVRETCVIGSSTASIPVARIAEVSRRPSWVVGMRYLAPVHGLSILEVVRTNLTDPRAVATAVALGRKQGRTVIVVHDGPAFYSTRILVPYFAEAPHLLSDGAAIEEVDRAMLDWGFATGPFWAMDEMGIDIVARAAATAEAAFGERVRHPAFASLEADHRYGRKNARGFYLYGSAAPRRRSSARGSGTERTADRTVCALLGVSQTARAPSRDEIALRCSLAMVNETFRCLGEGVLRCARDGDVGAIGGAGFPPFRGGPLRYVDVLGPAELLRRMRSLEQRFGTRFEPAPLLVETARSGKRLFG